MAKPIIGLDKTADYDKMDRMASNVPSYGTQRVEGGETSIRKALRILSSFSTNDTTITVSELARRHRMPKSSVSRILRDMAAEGFVAKDPDKGDYRLGIELFRLGNVALRTINIRQVAMVHMEKCSQEYGEVVHLAILNSSNEVVSLEATPSRYNLRADIHVGGKSEFYCTAVGKAILSFLDESDRKRVLMTERTKYTQNTIVDEKQLLREIERTRARGYAVDNMEHEEGVKCVGAPIFDRNDKVIAAMSISGPSVRFSAEKVHLYAKQVVEAAKRISYELGSSIGVLNDR